MKNEEAEMRIEGLTGADILELESKAKITRLPAKRGSRSGAYHDPTSIAVAVVAVEPVLILLGVILVRKISSTRRKIKITHVTKDESTSVQFDEKVYSSDAPKADVIKAVAEALKTDPTALAKALKGN
jgi:hypothetical protein